MMKKTIILLFAITLFFAGCKKDETLERGDLILNGHAMVDLGLPSGLLWATCNVGASSPEDYGDYYAWGETKKKSEYNNTNSDTYGEYADDISGNSQYDAARAKWGASWRIPTKTEFEELLSYCDLEMTERNGVSGCLVTGTNGNQIFLPATGYKNGESSMMSGSNGDYWSSTPDGRYDAYHFYFDVYNDNGSHSMSSYNRYYGRSVRAVSDRKTKGDNPIEPEIPEEPETPSQPEHNGHAYVDLGLSVKWATCNVGATSPEGYGDYFAWGETSTKETYDYDNCPTYGLSISELQSQGYIDSEGNLTAQYDAARANWGGSWRMPTEAEMQELEDRCTWTWTTQNSVNGYKVTGPSGASIFLSAAGYRYGSSLSHAGSRGYYWSSTPNDDNDDAYDLNFSSSSHYVYDNYRYLGLSVRPVIEPKGETPEEPETPIEPEIPEEPETPSQPEHNGHAYVDLGLSVKWATCNVGASSPSAYGDYFAWGETNMKLSYYEGNCSTSGVSVSDFSGNAQYDAATANWGGSWRMPTDSEMSELLYNCTWTWTGQGYEVKSKTNGNSIFLPAAGYKDSYVRDAGSGGYYWVSSPYYSSWEEDKYADDLYFYSTNYRSSYRSRFFGHSVRPVCEEVEN